MNNQVLEKVPINLNAELKKLGFRLVQGNYKNKNILIKEFKDNELEYPFLWQIRYKSEVLLLTQIPSIILDFVKNSQLYKDYQKEG